MFHFFAYIFAIKSLTTYMIINKQEMNMKKIVNYIVPAISLVAIVFSVAAFNKTCAATPTTNSVEQMSSLPAGQPVDLTYAADKALPTVVYIKNTQNSKTQTVEYSDPFSDFFSDPFGGFFGRGNG
jgi:hypothetical protein